MTTNVTHTPWGWTGDIEELAEGVWRVTTPSHGGLKLSRELWDSLPSVLRDAMYTQTFAEEDCEEPIVRTLLGLGGDRDRELALTIAGYFERYAPALPSLRDCPSAHHYHAVCYRNGHGSDPFERFDTRVEAESFADTGRWQAVSCEGVSPFCRGKGGRP